MHGCRTLHACAPRAASPLAVGAQASTWASETLGDGCGVWLAAQKALGEHHDHVSVSNLCVNQTAACACVCLTVPCMCVCVAQDFGLRLKEQGVDLGLELSVQVLTTGSWPTQVRRAAVQA